jgi:FkbM family methyltransferase
VTLSEMSQATLVGRIVRYPLRMIPRDLVVPILGGQLRGRKWLVGSQRHACWLGIYERVLQAEMTRELKPGGVFYDVGANVGFYSLLGSALIEPGRVFAFEPLPSNVAYLKRHLKLNKITNVEVLEIAISDKIGELPFLEEETRAMGRLGHGGKRLVWCSTLDSLLQEQRIPPPDFIKMDIEGAELHALNGAKDIFRKYRPILFLATHGREVRQDCRRLLESWEYKIKLLTDSGDDRGELVAKSKTPRV